jgi:formylglycine-generating enzyme required for sulfatase activity
MVSILPALITIPAGPFVMGTSQAQVDLLGRDDPVAARWREKGSFDREMPQHSVSLGPYQIGEHPVTVGQYRPFVEVGGYAEPRFWTGSGWSWCQASGRQEPDLWREPRWAGDDRLPVVGITWFEAVAYCHWLRQAVGLPCRLPSEAEWEKAARGTGVRLYPWGNEFEPDRCNTRDGGPGHTLPVGKHSPAGDSPYGCAEMGGNVSEWTVSKFWPYPYDASDGREELEGGAERVIRGGAWFKPSLRSRTSARGMNDAGFADHDVGFRLVCDVDTGH